VEARRFEVLDDLLRRQTRRGIPPVGLEVIVRECLKRARDPTEAWKYLQRMEPSSSGAAAQQKTGSFPAERRRQLVLEIGQLLSEQMHFTLHQQHQQSTESASSAEQDASRIQNLMRVILQTCDRWDDPTLVQQLGALFNQ